MTSRLLGLAGLLALLLSPGVSHAVGDQQGRIKGRVVEEGSGTPLPAVTVSTHSTALIGGNRNVHTDDDGRFELLDLPPGLYVVELSYPGMVSTTRKIFVAQGVTSLLDVRWSPEAAVTEAVSVVERRSLIKPDSTQTGTVLSRETLDRLPTGRSYQSAAQQVAGVSGGANPNIKGGLLLNNRYLVDGMDITDPVTGTFTTNLAFDATDSIDVITGGMEAQYNALGGVINVLTRSGSDHFHLTTSIYANRQSWADNGNLGPNLYDQRQSFNDTPTPNNDSLFAGLDTGGALIKHRLWIDGSYELRLTGVSVLKGPPLGAAPFDLQHPKATSQTHLGRVKLTYAPNRVHRFTLSGSLSPYSLDNASGGNSSLGIAENHLNTNNVFSVVSWDWFVSPAVTTNVQIGGLWSLTEQGPQGRLGDIDTTGCMLFSGRNCLYDPTAARHLNAVDGTAWYQGGAYQRDSRYKLQIDPSVSVRGRLFGRHDAKVGLQLQANYRRRQFEIPGGATYTDNTSPGVPLEGGLCDPFATNPTGCFRRTEVAPFKAHERGLGGGLYIQDRWWTPLSWLSVVPGLRFDYGRTTDHYGDEVTELAAIGPRLGFIAELTRDARTTLFAYYGRHTETLSLLPASNYDAERSAVSVSQQWNPAEKKFSIETGRSGGDDTVSVNQKATAPHMDEVSGGLRREIFYNSVAGVDYTWRHYANLWAEIESNRIWDPTGSRVVGWVDPNRPFQDIYRFDTPDDNERKYQGVDFYAQGRPTRNWDFGTSYTLSWTYGSATTVFNQVTNLNQYGNRRQARFFDGFLAQDIRHFLRLWGSYEVAQHFTLGANFSYATGTPLTKTFFNYGDGAFTSYRSPLGTEPGAGNDAKTISDFRLPDVATLDLRVVINLLPTRLGQRLNLICDLFNAFDTRTPVSLVTLDVPTFAQVSNRQPPLRLQIAINYLY